MDQRRAFLEREADRYFARNQAAMADLARRASADPVVRLVRVKRWRPQSILEVGCSDGWRLEALGRLTGARCTGVDPSADALSAGRASRPGIRFIRACADAVPVADASIDLLVYGFCLYLCDRDRLGRILAEAERITSGPGRIVVFDFHVDAPTRVPYRHFDGLFSFKADHAALFAAPGAFVIEADERLPYGNGSGDQLQLASLRRRGAA